MEKNSSPAGIHSLAYKPKENTDVLHIENPLPKDDQKRARNRRNMKNNNLGNAYVSAMDVANVNHKHKSQAPSMIHYNEELTGRRLASQYSPRDDSLRDSNQVGDQHKNKLLKLEIRNSKSIAQKKNQHKSSVQINIP